MTAILGLSAYYHDSAAALLVDGKIVGAAQEERFTRKKHDDAFPELATQWCLKEAGLGASDLDYVVFYEKPIAKFERLLETYLATAPRGFTSFRKAIPLWVQSKLHLPREMRSHLEGYKRPFLFLDHHESHAASAFYPSPFERAAVLTIDGVGEWATASWGVGTGNALELREEQRFPHSLGLLYSAITYFCGFRVNSGEYKLMGLAPYGRPVYVDALYDVVRLDDSGALHLDQTFFDYCHGLRMTSKRFAEKFGGPPRKPESAITQREMDLAASVQQITEEAVLRMARYVFNETGEKALCLAGGVALNCVANGRLRREGPFDDIFIQPAAGDAGGALGAALRGWHSLMDQPRSARSPDAMDGALLGPSFTLAEAETALERVGAKFTVCASEQETAERTAKRLSEQAVVGWFQGRMEFGPRALGSRSILADPRNQATQSTVNLKIKYRESFRPFAPCCLAERAAELFEVEPGASSPYMLEVCQVRGAKPIELSSDALSGDEASLGKALGRASENLPAITHLDGSARLQTVDERHPDLRRVLHAFEAATGCPVLVNTSFNIRGEPIVCTPEDAFRCFLATEMDVLVVGRCFLEKSDQDAALTAAERDRHLAQFELD